MNVRRLAIAGVLAAAAVLTGACTDDSDRTTVGPAAERRLTSQIAMIQEAVSADDQVAARSAVLDLQGSVADLQAAGSVAPNRAARILAATQLMLEQLSLLPPPPRSSALAPSPESSEPLIGGEEPSAVRPSQAPSD